ncbi:MAG: hypothetical protein KF757_12405 [Phycisphaeraceae bacterium]|nr:hypothetical protein [Phycisphaeraceae bacterium]MCW5762492.1 hypothetical protein [Phycisphaeraceae bacterium]
MSIVALPPPIMVFLIFGLMCLGVMMVALGYSQTRFTESGVVHNLAFIRWEHIQSWEWKNDWILLLTLWRNRWFANTWKIRVPTGKRQAVENMLRARAAAGS